MKKNKYNKGFTRTEDGLVTSHSTTLLAEVSIGLDLNWLDPDYVEFC